MTQHVPHILPVAGAGAHKMQQAHGVKRASYPFDAGHDLYPVMNDTQDLRKDNYGFYQIWSIPTQVSVGIPADHVGLILGRSSSYSRLMGCSVVPGVIDCGYTGEYRIRVQVPCTALDQTLYFRLERAIYGFSQRGEALAQLLVLPFLYCHQRVVEALPESSRGTNGYGSTDHLVTACLCGRNMLRLGELICAECSKEAAERMS